MIRLGGRIDFIESITFLVFFFSIFIFLFAKYDYVEFVFFFVI
ncbi:unnamed protein product [Tenebrio molitor]|nr:unnamed protein product [Tenebrio molitor]